MPQKLVLILLALLALPLNAQRSEASLSDKEIEELRDSAYIANDRVMVFIKLMN